MYSGETDRAGRIDSIAKKPGYAKFSMSVETPMAFLSISESNYRGWEITVDGRRVEPMTVNELFMGIPVVRDSTVYPFSSECPIATLSFC
jgi:hypothetical protein